MGSARFVLAGLAIASACGTDTATHRASPPVAPSAPAPAPVRAAPTELPDGSATVTSSAITHVEIRYSYAGMMCSNKHTYTIDKAGAAYRTDAGRAIDASLITALAGALMHLEASDTHATCMDHTDDYPSFEVALGDVVLSSTSNCGPANAPWNVVRDGTLFVQRTGQIGEAVYALLVAVDPDHWTPARGAWVPWYHGCERP